MKLTIGTVQAKRRDIFGFLKKLRLKMNDHLWRYGHMPLPPYISVCRKIQTGSGCQTVYAEKQGSLAAPTAGLHFTNDLIGKIRDKGILVRFLTLHVGTGTFKPVRAESLEDHDMDTESFEISRHIIEELKQVKERGGKLVAVGTTTTRTMEGIASGKCMINPPLLPLDKGGTGGL